MVTGSESNCRIGVKTIFKKSKTIAAIIATPKLFTSTPFSIFADKKMEKPVINIFISKPMIVPIDCFLE